MTRPEAVPLAAAPPPVLPAGSLRRPMLGLLSGAILGSGAVLAVLLISLRAEALRSAERVTEAFAHVIAEQTSRTFQNVDQRLQLSLARLDQLGRARSDESAVRALLRSEIAELPFVRAISLADALGRIIHSTEPGAVGRSLADRAYFQVYLREPRTAFYIGPPVRSRVNGAWLISASRPVTSASGAFAGVIVAAVEPAYFDRLWQIPDLGTDGSIALFRRDGMMMMRSPFDDAAVGRTLPTLGVFSQPLATRPAGHFVSTSVVDGTKRLFGYRVLAGHPDLIVVVGQAYGGVLASWRQLTLIVFSVWGAASLAIAILGVFLDRAGAERIRSAVDAERMAKRLTLATEASSIGVWDWDLEADRWYATPTYFSLLGYGPDEGVGRREEWLSQVHPDDRTVVASNIQAALEGADVPYRHDARVRHADGSYRWMSITGRVLARDERGKPSRLIGVMVDITEGRRADEALRASLHEKEGLLKEIHHRVKNNLQVITSLLRLESSRARESGTKDVLKEMQGRIRSMALLHETLYRSGKFARVELSEYIRQLATQLFRAQNAAPGRVQLILDLSPVTLTIDHAIPCGLIVNELLTNSLKHGFPPDGGGEVRISLEREPGDLVRVRVSDSGIGLPDDFDSKRGSSLGLQLVSDLARQLGGALEVGPPPKAVFTVTFKAADLEVRA